MNNEELLTPDELAERLKVNKSWIYAQTRETGKGAIPRLRCGKYLRFELSKVRAWLDAREA